jgi:hypothetical protein
VLTRDEAIVSTADALVTSVVDTGNAAQGQPRHELHRTETWEQSQQESYAARRAFIESVHACFAGTGHDG